ncbi:uncharacterized protein LOC144928290 [Branchiostoma floridae x Branchiostoma belcheri]
MDVAESVVCSHCNTRVYRQWLVDHVQQELLDETTCRPCADVLQMLTDLLCALHLHGHLKTPVINITCSRCCFKAGSVEKFVEHLQARCKEDTCEKVAPDTAAAVSHASVDLTDRQRVKQLQNDVEEGKGEGGSCEKTLGTRTLGERMGASESDGQQFQQMMSTSLLTDTSEKRQQKTSPEEDIGGRNKVTIDMASVCEDEEDDTVSEDGMNYDEPKTFSSQSLEEKNTANQGNDTDISETKDEEDAIGLIMECEVVEEHPYPSQSNMEGKKTANQENLKRTSRVKNVRCHQKTKLRDDTCHELEGRGKKSKTKIVKASKAKKQQLENLLKCHMCGYSDQKKDGLESHMLETHGKVEYRCNNCEFVAETVEEVHQHQLSIGHQRTHKCRHCDFTTHWQKNLILHEKRHSETEKYISCEICRKDVPKSTYKRHRERHSRKFTCPTCSKTFPEKGLLKIHTDFTHDNKVLQCSYCDKTFRSYAGYMMHRYVHVSDEHTCKDCDLKFRTKALLYHHRRKAHLPFKEYTCEVCGKVLASPRRLKDHRKIHMGDEAKVYKCTKCPASFKWAGSLRKHQNSHELLKTCTICRKHYQGTRGLKRHMATVHKELFES